MSKTHWLDLLTFGLPAVGLVVLSVITKHPIMWAVAGVWTAIGVLLFYFRSRK